MKNVLIVKRNIGNQTYLKTVQIVGCALEIAINLSNCLKAKFIKEINNNIR
jgi:hypothetical protein